MSLNSHGIISMNKRQQFAYDSAARNVFVTATANHRRIVDLKGLKLSTILSVDWLGEYFAWHASVSVLTDDGLHSIPSNKLSKKNRVRAEIYLEKLLEGVGEEYVHQSEAHGKFNLFRRLSDDEDANLKDR